MTVEILRRGELRNFLRHECSVQSSYNLLAQRNISDAILQSWVANRDLARDAPLGQNNTQALLETSIWNCLIGSEEGLRTSMSHRGCVICADSNRTPAR